MLKSRAPDECRSVRAFARESPHAVMPRSEVVLPVVRLVDVHPALAAHDDALARTLLDRHLRIARNAEISAVLHGLAFDQHLRDLVHRETGLFRTTEYNSLHRAAFE